jgi:hypothetical protein
MRKAPNLSRLRCHFILGFLLNAFVHSFYSPQQISPLISIGAYFLDWLITKAAAFKFRIDVCVRSFMSTAFISIFKGQEALQPCNYCPKRGLTTGTSETSSRFPVLKTICAFLRFFNLQFQVQFRVPSLGISERSQL